MATVLQCPNQRSSVRRIKNIRAETHRSYAWKRIRFRSTTAYSGPP